MAADAPEPAAHRRILRVAGRRHFGEDPSLDAPRKNLTRRNAVAVAHPGSATRVYSQNVDHAVVLVIDGIAVLLPGPPTNRARRVARQCDLSCDVIYPDGASFRRQPLE